jgi:hypothetical protein
VIERAVEDWLTSASERDFQTPFTQVLFAQGHRILYMSRHRPLEEGKDLVTIDPEGGCCAYQLKTGDIDIGRWRHIQGELNDLVELPVDHPAVTPDCSHKAYLVTNGDISDEVRHRIALLNQKNQSRHPLVASLGVIGRGDLARDFVNSHGDFLPSRLEDLREFLALYLSDGRSFFPKEQFCRFLSATVLNDLSAGPKRSLRAITSAVVLTSYIAGAFQRTNNHFALFEAWICLLAEVIRYATRGKLQTEVWKPTYELILTEVVGRLTALRSEALDREDFLEEPIMGDGGPLYRVRATMVLGAVAALENYLSASQQPEGRAEDVLALYRRYSRHLLLWGESAMPFFFSLIRFLETYGHFDSASELLRVVTYGIVQQNSPESNEGLPSPYFSAQEILDELLRLKDSEIGRYEYAGQSYSLESLVLMFARRNRRDVLTELWPRVAHIAFAEFVPANDCDIFAWRTQNGINKGALPTPTQSWRGLVDRAHRVVSEASPILDTYKQLLHFLILVYPHRFTPAVTGLLDGASVQQA